MNLPPLIPLVIFGCEASSRSQRITDAFRSATRFSLKINSGMRGATRFFAGSRKHIKIA